MTDNSPSIVVSSPIVQEPPAFSQPGYAFDLAENADGGTNRVSLGIVAAVDPDGTAVEYSLVAGNGSGLFQVEAATGELFYTGSGEDYESGTTPFALRVRASDGTLFTDMTVTVNVTDMPEQAIVEAPVAQTPPQAGATDLGDITGLAGPAFPTGTLDGGADAVDYFRFTLTETKRIGLGLRQQETNADLFLEDEDGVVIASMTTGGTANEELPRTLLAGTYFVRIEAQEAGASTYVFRYGVNAPDPDEVTRLQAQMETQTEPEAEQQTETSGGYSADTGTAGVVTVGGSVTGEVEESWDLDWFAVELTAGTRYRIDLEGYDTGDDTLGNPYLFGIYDSNGQLLSGTTNNDGGTGRNSRVYFEAATDSTYYVAAGALFDSHLGTYTLSVAAIGDDFAAATSMSGRVTVGGSATGEIETPGDQDWFAVDLTAGTRYRIDLEGSPTGDGTLRDPYLRGIYDSNGQLLSGTTNNDGGTGRNSRVYFEATTAGTYYVAAGNDGSGTGTYRLSVAATEDDFASATSMSGRVTVGGSATGEVETPGDQDWFAVDLAAGTRYRIDLEGSPTGDGTLRDPYLRGIHDADGNLISGTSNDDTGTGRNSRVYFEATTAGTYYVAAGGDGSGTGTYRLSVAATEGDFTAAPSMSGMVTVGGSATGEVETPGDQDWFAVVLTAGTRYRIDLEGSPTGDGTLRDPYLRGVYDSNGQLLSGTTNDDGYGTGRNSRVYFEAPTDGTYYVAAGNDGSGTGTYTLSVAAIRSVAAIGDDFAAAPSMSGMVTVGGSATGEVEESWDLDWFAVELTGDTHYQIDLEGRPTRDGTLQDPYLFGIYDSNGQLFSGTNNNDGGTRENSRLYFDAPTDGTYYVSAGAFDTRRGTYTLSVAALEDDFTATTSTSGVVTVGGSATGEIEGYVGDRDWFAVVLTAGTRYRIDLEGVDTRDGTLLDPYLHGIYNSNGQLLSGTGDSNGGTGDNARVHFEATTDGTYYVAAGAGFESNTGTYTLSVVEDAI